MPSLDTQAVSSALSTGYLTPRSLSHLLLPERNLNPVAVKEAYLFHGFLTETFWQSCLGHFGYGVREAGILGSYNSATFWPNDLSQVPHLVGVRFILLCGKVHFTM